MIAGGMRDFRAPVIAPGRWEAGRIVALGHIGYFLQPDTLESLDTGRLVTNALYWAAGDESASARIGVAGLEEFEDLAEAR